MTGPSRSSTADVVVIGGGVIGLTAAFACSSVGLSGIMVDDRRPGEASPAAAGMLAPSLEHADGPAQAFAIRARDRFPAYLELIEEAGGGHIPRLSNGILELPSSEAEADRLRRRSSPEHVWHDAAAVAAIEPGCAAPFGGLHHLADGAVDNVVLVDALRRVLEARANMKRVSSAAVAVRLSELGATVRLADGGVLSAGTIILAAGAWAPELEGLPRPLPIEPLRGQMVGFASAMTRHILYGADGYAVPRSDGRTIFGTTMERVGFDPATTEEARKAIVSAAVALCPALASVPVTSHWAGLRPVTPDLLPIIGPDPSQRRLIYACGHSRNGILMAGLTGECVAALAAGRLVPHDLGPFSVARFQ